MIGEQVHQKLSDQSRLYRDVQAKIRSLDEEIKNIYDSQKDQLKECIELREC
jgi:hypothetical protein